MAPAMYARISVSRVDMNIFDSPASTILVTNSEGTRYDISSSSLRSNVAERFAGARYARRMPSARNEACRVRDEARESERTRTVQCSHRGHFASQCTTKE